jgi:hypothetical protein
MENINWEFVMYIMGKQLVQLVEPSCCIYDGRNRTTADTAIGVTSQDATGFTHTPVKSPSLNKEMTKV